MFRTMDRECESFFHLSPYTFCAGDPINFTDPTGNRVVAYDDDGTEWEFRNVDGEYNFYNANNERYDGVSNLILSAEDDLKKIVSGAVGNRVVTSLIESDKTLILEIGNSNTTKMSINEDGNTSYTIQWAPTDTSGGISRAEDGTLTNYRPPFIGLAHELGHSYDFMILNNENYRSEWFSFPDNHVVTKSDIIAGNIENAIRFEHNISPRLYYGNNANEGDYHPSYFTYIFTLFFVTKFH